MKSEAIPLALGVFLGNWFVVPLVFESRSFTDGFFIGLIAAVLVLIFYAVFYRRRS